MAGYLILSSNVQFGEGGAGTFSDGKLNTVIKDPTGRIREVLRTFVDTEQMALLCILTSRI